MLTITDITCRVAGRPLLEGASLALPAGHKAGLIGRNGTGKTTLLKLIAGDLHADTGEIRLPNGTRVGRIAQEAPSGPQSLLDTVLAADSERHSLLEEAEHATDPHRIADIHQRLHELDAHSAPAPSCTASASMPRRSSGPATTSPAAGACAWRSLRCCSRRPTCCCWTSRPTTSTSRRPFGSRTSFGATRTPCCWSATI